jgi:hypothetical protein
MYVESQTITIRRLVDWDRRSVSLLRLLVEMLDYRELLGRRLYLELFLTDEERADPDRLELAHLNFDTLAGARSLSGASRTASWLSR